MSEHARGDARDARLQLRSNAFGLGNVQDRAIRFRASQITATFELTGLSGLRVRSPALRPMPRAKRERDLDDLARRFAFEFSPPLPLEMREGRIHR